MASMVAGRGRRVVGRVEEHGADPYRARDGEVAGRDGSDGMTIDEQLRDIARRADRHQQVITAEEIVRRASSHGAESFAARSPFNDQRNVVNHVSVQFTEEEAT